MSLYKNPTLAFNTSMAATEIGYYSRKEPTDRTHVKYLKEALETAISMVDPTDRVIISRAYKIGYNEELDSESDISKKTADICKKLGGLEELSNEELKKLHDFCLEVSRTILYLRSKIIHQR